MDVYEPKSASDLAEEIGKTPQTVRYHLSSLLELGLIIAVATRQRRSRTETLYVHKARRSFSRGIEGDAEYNRYVVRGFKLRTQMMVREAAYAYGWLEHDHESGAFIMHHYRHLTLTPARARRLKVDLMKLIDEAAFDQVPRSAGGAEVHTVAVMRPTLVQTKLWAKAAGVPFKDLNRDGPVQIDDGDEEPADSPEEG